MSRTAFYDELIADPDLNSLGLDENTIFHNFSSEERPTDDGPFIIIRWGTQNPPMFNGEVKGVQNLRLWVHWPIQRTNDHIKLIEILDRIDDLVKELRDIPGSDGYTLSFVDIGGRSEDLVDDGFGTITKNSEYYLHLSKS